MIPVCPLWIACQFRCAALLALRGGVRFRGEAGYGKDHADRQTFYGFRLHAQLSWPGVLTRVFLGSRQRSGRRKLRPCCWKGQQGSCWEIAIIGFPICRRICGPKALSCKPRFARPIRPRLLLTKALFLGRVRYLIDTVFRTIDGSLSDENESGRVICGICGLACCDTF